MLINNKNKQKYGAVRNRNYTLAKSAQADSREFIKWLIWMFRVFARGLILQWAIPKKSCEPSLVHVEEIVG